MGNKIKIKQSVLNEYVMRELKTQVNEILTLQDKEKLAHFRKKKIEEMGGKVAESITSKTNYLVVKSNDEIEIPTTKVLKAIENGIELITKEKLLIMLQKN